MWLYAGCSKTSATLVCFQKHCKNKKNCLFCRGRSWKGDSCRSRTRSNNCAPAGTQPHNIRFDPEFLWVPILSNAFFLSPLQQDDPCQRQRVVRGKPQLSNSLLLCKLKLSLLILILLLLLTLLLNLNQVRKLSDILIFEDTVI